MSRHFHRAVAHGSIARAGSVIGAMTAHLLAVRSLGVAHYGQFALAESVVIVLSIIALCGIHVSCFALVGERRASLGAALKAGGATILVLVALEGLLATAVATTFDGAALIVNAWAAPAALSVTGLSAYRYVSELVRITRSVKLANYFSGRANGFVATAAFALLVASHAAIHQSLTPQGLLWMFGTGQWIGVAIGLLFVRPVQRAAATEDIWNLKRQFMQRGPMISLTQQLQFVLGSADLWLLSLLGNPVALGVYSLGKRFAVWLVAPTGLVALSAKKRAVNEYLRDGRVSQSLEVAFRHAIWRSWSVVVVVVFCAALLPASWLQAVVGEHASQSRWLFVGIGIGQMLRLLFGNGGPILGAAGHEADNLRAHFYGALAGVGVSATTIPLMQGWGAVLGYSVGMILSAVITSRACQQQMGFTCDLLRIPMGRPIAVER